MITSLRMAIGLLRICLLDLDDFGTRWLDYLPFALANLQRRSLTDAINKNGSLNN